MTVKYDNIIEQPSNSLRAQNQWFLHTCCRLEPKKSHAVHNADEDSHWDFFALLFSSNKVKMVADMVWKTKGEVGNFNMFTCHRRSLSPIHQKVMIKQCFDFAIYNKRLVHMLGTKAKETDI